MNKAQIDFLIANGFERSNNKISVCYTIKRPEISIEDIALVEQSEREN